MPDDHLAEIRRRLDEDLSLERFEGVSRPTEEAATRFFRDIFVRVLDFDAIFSATRHEPWQELPAHRRGDGAGATAARVFAESGEFRVVYVELETLTRTAERNAIRSLARSDRTGEWATGGSVLAVFHAPGAGTWHLVTPYGEDTDDVTTGRPVLRRYTLGEGETHRTVASALQDMDASHGRLGERIDDAFRVESVIEDFYGDYRSVFEIVRDELRGDGLDIEDADRYAHLTLNRLLFLYFVQKDGWIGDRTDFVSWFHEQYEFSDGSDGFHETWLSALFFDGANRPAGEPIETDLPVHVEDAVASVPHLNCGLFEPTELDRTDTYLSDAALHTIIRGFLEKYNFTVAEESPYDVDVAVDPAMLGKIYESLIAEQERGEAGIFYTPRVEVDLMCRMALYEQFCDHTDGPDAGGEQEIVEFVFGAPRDWDPGDAVDTEILERILHELRIVDPACGSGAFLVGMKRVLAELYRKLDATPDHHLEERIVRENLCGVDVKDWAVRVAEFRLQLSLIDGEDDLPDRRPMLPDLSFTLRVGDSLVQKLDGTSASLDTLTRSLDGDAGDRLAELKELKREHFEGTADRTGEIEDKQVELLREHVTGLVDRLSTDSTGQTHRGDERDALDAGAGARVEELEELRDAIDRSGNPDSFVWDVDFSEVMVEGGFDVVIGNPPYVRQEDIVDQGIHPERLEAMDEDRVDELQDQYKDALVDYVEGSFDIRPYKRSDIYVYFYFRGIDLLSEGGTLAFITSSSWLDIGYGKRLHEGLLELTDLSYVLGNTSEKSFEDADVNTCITIANRRAEGVLTDRTRFVRFDRGFLDYDYAAEFEEFLVSPEDSARDVPLDGEVIQVTTTDGTRTVSIAHESLWRLGGGSTREPDRAEPDRVSSGDVGTVSDPLSPGSYSNDGCTPTGSYEDGIWGRFIEAPTLYFSIWGNAGDRFGTLGSLVGDERGLERGTTSGANAFFFVPRPGRENTTFESSMDEESGELVLAHKDTGEEYYVEKEFWMRDAKEIPDRFVDGFEYVYEDGDTSLVPDLILVKNREIQRSPIEPGHLNSVHVRIEGQKSDLSDKNAMDYIELGEEAIWGRTGRPLPERPTLSGTPWYEQPSCRSPFLLLNRTFNANFQFHYSPCLFEVADNFFYLPEPDVVTPEYLAGYMNSTLGWFVTEVTARAWTNTLRMDKFEYQQLPVLTVPDEIDGDIESELEKVTSRGVGNVFEELNAYDPDEFDITEMKQDRRRLDDPFLREIGVRTDREREEFYQVMIRMVRDRLMRQPGENPSLCETIADHNPQYDYTS